MSSVSLHCRCSKPSCFCVCVPMCATVCIYAHTYVSVYTYTYIYIHIHVCICIYTHSNTCVYTYANSRIYIYIYMYLCDHMHSHVHRHRIGLRFAAIGLRVSVGSLIFRATSSQDLWPHRILNRRHVHGITEQEPHPRRCRILPPAIHAPQKDQITLDSGLFCSLFGSHFGWVGGGGVRLGEALGSLKVSWARRLLTGRPKHSTCWSL